MMRSNRNTISTTCVVLLATLVFAILACTITASSADVRDFSTIDVMSVNYDKSATSVVSSAFRGRLFCADDCTTNDKFSMIAGLTTHNMRFEVQSMQITFFNEQTGETLVKLDHDAKFLQFVLTSNRFDDKSIPWLAPIPAGTYVGFKGSLNFNWVSKDLADFIDSAMITYMPANQYTYPQTMVFDQRFSQTGAEFAFIDGLWPSKDHKEGKLTIILDNISTDIWGVQIKLIGIKWLTEVSRGCVMNGIDVYNLLFDKENNTMTFIGQEKILAHSDLIITCHEPILTVKDITPIDFSITKEAFAEIRFAQNPADWYSPNFFYGFTLSRSLFNIIEQAVPEFTTSSTLYGNQLVCSFGYTLVDFAGQRQPIKPDGEFFSFQLSGIEGVPGNAIVHVTTGSIDTNPIVLQRVNKLQQNKNVYNRSPLTFTLPKDKADMAITSITITAFIPLDNITSILPMGPMCRFNLIKPNIVDKDMLYTTAIKSTVYDDAFESISLLKWSTPLNSTSTQFGMTFGKAKSTFDRLIFTTTTYDFLWTGNYGVCGITQLTPAGNTKFIEATISIPEDEEVKNEDEEKKMIVSPESAVGFDFSLETPSADENRYRASTIHILLNDTITPGSTATLDCLSLFYSALPSTEHDLDIIQSPNTILVMGALVESQKNQQNFQNNIKNMNNNDLYEQLVNPTIIQQPIPNAIKKYGSGMVTPPFTLKKNGFPTGAIVFIVLLLIVIGGGVAAYIYRRHQATKRQEKEQFETLLNDERTTLVIQ